MNTTTTLLAAPEGFDWLKLLAKLDGIEQLLSELRSEQTVRDWYSTEEVAKLLGKAEFTVREWCRLRRIHGEKRQSGRGAHRAWVISHAELQRLQREGLLPLS
jgi:Helix-turn-helix domain